MTLILDLLRTLYVLSLVLVIPGFLLFLATSSPISNTLMLAEMLINGKAIDIYSKVAITAGAFMGTIIYFILGYFLLK